MHLARRIRPLVLLAALLAAGALPALAHDGEGGAFVVSARISTGPGIRLQHVNEQAQTIIYQQTVQGGVAVDASGVSTPVDGSTTWYNGDPFEVVIPSSAMVTDVYVFVRAGFSGFHPAIPVASAIAINGTPLSSAALIQSGPLVRVYELDPTTFGITGSGSYSYAEQGRADEGFQAGFKIDGSTLAVVYQDLSRSGTRHIVIGFDAVTNGSRVIANLPTVDTAGQMLVSLGIDWECSDEQNSSVYINGQLVTSVAGGRDDGVAFATVCAFQDWNSMITQGSFGFDDTDVWVGVEGDSPGGEPGSGTTTNSRLSDELWTAPYDESGSASWTYVGDGDSYATVFTAVVEMDPAFTAVGDRPVRAPGGLNAPNPFRDFTRIEFALPAAGSVSFEVFDASGRRVSTRSLDGRVAGKQEYAFDGRDDAGDSLPSGVYFYRFVGAGSTAINKMVIIR